MLGEIIKSNKDRSYRDFRRSDVREYLREKVIKFLKANDFGYIKVDYNRNIGRYIDNAEFGAVALSAVSSFSDAHETVEIPYIAANLHRLMLPAQSLIWSVLNKEDTLDRTIYSLVATFLGRMCLSGDIDKLNDEQKNVLRNAIGFYKKLDNIIINGSTHIYGNRGRNTRYPQGTQVVLRETEDEMLVVCHAFENPCGAIGIDIPKGYKICDTFNGENIRVIDGKLVVNKMDSFTAAAVETRIKSCLSCAFFNDRIKYNWSDFVWFDSENKFTDVEVALLVQPRPIYICIADKDQCLDYETGLNVWNELKSNLTDEDNIHFIGFEGTHEFIKEDEPIQEFINDLFKEVG